MQVLQVLLIGLSELLYVPIEQRNMLLLLQYPLAFESPPQSRGALLFAGVDSARTLGTGAGAGASAGAFPPVPARLRSQAQASALYACARLIVWLMLALACW
jgi:hypothetical protein